MFLKKCLLFIIEKAEPSGRRETGYLSLAVFFFCFLKNKKQNVFDLLLALIFESRKDFPSRHGHWIGQDLSDFKLGPETFNERADFIRGKDLIIFVNFSV